MRDARVREHPLRVRLRESDDVAAGHGEGREDGEDGAPVDAERPERADQQSQDRGEGRRFRADGHEGRRRRRGSVIRIGGPLVERDDCRLEPEPDGDESERDDRRTVGDALRREHSRDRGEVGRMGDPIQPDEAVEQERRAERAEQEVLERGLVRVAIRPLDAREDVDRDGHRLETNEQGDQIGRQRDGHRADGREADDRVVLAGGNPAAREICGRDERREDREQYEDRAEERRERVDRDEPTEVLTRGDRAEDAREGHQQASDGDDGEDRALAALAERRAGDENDHRDDRHDDLWVDRGDVARIHSQGLTWTPAGGTMDRSRAARPGRPTVR